VLYDVAVIGGGIVGLASALRLAERGRTVVVLEKEASLAAHQTGHNSGVIHSGLYYKPGSEKARLCVEGARLLVEFCERHEIPHAICGKVVVATSERELPALAELTRRGRENGVAGLEEIGPERLREIEPHARGLSALRVPGTGIVDYAAVTRKYGELVAAAGGAVRTGARVTAIDARESEVRIETEAGEFRSRRAVTCGGLHSDRLARLEGAEPDALVVPFRGEYYRLVSSRENLVRGLIYPVPDPRFPFLGVHFTRMIAGGVEAGPNAVLALKREGYSKTAFSARDAWETLTFPGFWRMARRHWRMEAGEVVRSFVKSAFVRSLQKLVPEIRGEDLEVGGSGVRAQSLLRSGALEDDFHILDRGKVIHVLNAPSPAATASLAIGERIAALVDAARG
jgi:(S)-2-hydroxyglutarate dehydrogenase